MSNSHVTSLGEIFPFVGASTHETFLFAFKLRGTRLWPNGPRWRVKMESSHRLSLGTINIAPFVKEHVSEI